MGLKRMGQDSTPFYMYFNISSSGENKQELEAVVLTKDNPTRLKVTASSDDLQRWRVKLGKSAEEYLGQLCEAVASEDDNVEVFEVQGDHLVWKQYFPDKGIYGKKGRFKMEKVEYKEAVEQVLAGVVEDLHKSSREVHRLTQETQENAIKLLKAQELASESIQIKEDFEREIYSKCAALINAKKLRIHQLRSTHPSSSAAGRSGCLVRTGDEVATSSTPPVKRPRKQEADSDGYSSDTDVDDPDEEIDTDEEKATSLSPVKLSKDRGMAKQDQNEEKTKDSNIPDSQELFNNSIEAELFPSVTVVQQKANSSTSHTNLSIQSPPQLVRSNAAQPVPSSSSPATSKDDCDDETQMSILNTLF
ncbi:uncharacterized protein LOC123509987 isoform X1 [Portunus trituberculatus]|uniref:uncharacterized protein LOC123509987 isoform X1 n=1 Tax=Portunus trituberculatus TaxID=210409 RepID=UPI001E1CB7C1|nr:uncharacterized protein LOC123509987 isoform X1 [Portunus trituberculatus]